MSYNNSVFKKLSDESTEAGEAIRAALPSEEFFKLFNAFDCVRNSEENRMLEAVYEQAFKDGMEFYKHYIEGAKKVECLD